MKVFLQGVLFFIVLVGSFDFSIRADEGKESLLLAKQFLDEHALVKKLPTRIPKSEKIRAEIQGKSDPETKFGYVVFSIARHGEALLTPLQQERWNALLESRKTAAINWHDVRNMVRVKAQIAMWEYAEERDEEQVAAKKQRWQSWTDLRLAYMEQEFIDKERFQRAAWSILTEEQRNALRSGSWDSYLKKSKGHKRLFSADKQITRVLGKPDDPEAFSKAVDHRRALWEPMWNAYQKESQFERQREFAMDLADEAFSIHSWRDYYAPAFRAFAEQECESIREILQSGYELDGEKENVLDSHRNKLGEDAAFKYEESHEAIRGLFPKTLTKRPNFIIIMVDDMGYAGLSCFGNPYFETPELDRLASEGIRFSDFHSSGTVCSPTRAGLLTGRYQQRAGIEAVIHPYADHPEHRKGLQLSETTFAEVLQSAGYATALVGKWHQGYPQNSDEFHPQEHGFDEFVGYHSGNIDFVSHIGDHSAHDWWHGRTETPEKGYSTHLINRYALEFIRRQGKTEEPFCLYLAHEAIHNPLQKPGDPVRRTRESWDRWDWRNAPREEVIDMFRGMTLPVDEGIGAIRSLLEEQGIAENTLVFFFSDNGGAAELPSNSPQWRGGKGSVYEGGHRVPALAWWPRQIEAGQVFDTPLISIDIMPTILSLAGLDTEELGLDGVDLSPLLKRGEAPEERPLFWASMSNRGNRSEAMREGPWKLVVTHPQAPPGTFENEKIALYHLENDPGESTDLASQETERAIRMQKAIKDWYADTQTKATPQPGGWLSGEKVE